MTALHLDNNGMLLRACYVFALLLACAGCGTRIVAIQGNYMTFEHPFTDAGAESARALAERDCNTHNQVAVRTGGACSLTQCTTHFQCMAPAEAKQYQQ